MGNDIIRYIKEFAWAATILFSRALISRVRSWAIDEAETPLSVSGQAEAGQEIELTIHFPIACALTKLVIARNSRFSIRSLKIGRRFLIDSETPSDVFAPDVTNRLILPVVHPGTMLVLKAKNLAVEAADLHVTIWGVPLAHPQDFRG